MGSVLAGILHHYLCCPLFLSEKMMSVFVDSFVEMSL